MKHFLNTHQMNPGICTLSILILVKGKGTNFPWINTKEDIAVYRHSDIVQ